MDKERSIYIKTEAMTKLGAEAKERVSAKMQERIAAEEAKQIERRAKQEQQLAYRAQKKAALRDAQDADRVVANAALDIKEFLQQRKGAKTKAQTAAERVHKASKQIQNYANLLAQAQEELLEAQHEHQQTKQVADDSILQLKHERLRCAMAGANKRWEAVQKAVRKKERDRALKKQAKELLDEGQV